MSNIRPDDGYTVTLPSFEGPLDLLLRLIEQAKLDITTIALARVTDQYLAHVRALPAPEPRALAEFVALASRLLLIKSRTLLPPPPGNSPGTAVAAEDDGAALAHQLRMYQQYKQAAQHLRNRQEQGCQVFVRTATPPAPAEPRRATLDHTPSDLIAALERRVQLALPLVESRQALPMPPRLTVADVVTQVYAHLSERNRVLFDDLLQSAPARQAIIVTFWAVLELWKRQIVVVQQDQLFGRVQIGRGQHFDQNRGYRTERSTMRYERDGV